MKKLSLYLLPLLLFAGLCLSPALAAGPEPIVILYTNDVHCGMAQSRDSAGAVTGLGYSGVAAYRAEMEALYGADRVTLVDGGDAVQGEAVGTLSNGRYPLEAMNEAGYDFAVPGNHEFDYGMDAFFDLAERADFEYLCCNFLNHTGQPVFRPYALVDYGNASVAYVGISTPETFTKSTPTYFQDGTGSYIYSFCEGEGELYAAVQSAVNGARNEGADYVVAVAHLGQSGSAAAWRSDAVIANTTGIDALLDGHSHEQYAASVPNREGEPVTVLQTGTKLAALGKLTIDPASGTLSGELVSGYEGQDPKVSALLEETYGALEEILQQQVAYTEVPLTMQSAETGDWVVRYEETNLGDLCADAYRIMLGADVGLVNGGGIRADIGAGPITYEEIINVHPYGNQLCLALVTGDQLLDALELGARMYPQECGGFLQVSGLTYAIDPTVPSSVVLSEQGAFLGVDGPRRVWDVKVGGVPIEGGKLYRLAGHDYMLKSGGDGFTMFQGCELLQDEAMLDNQALIRYITEKLAGAVGEEYANPQGQGRIAAAAMPAQPEEEKPVISQETFYVVQKGDSLWKIARKTLGSGTRWKEIYEMNQSVLRNPNFIRVGQKLVLPSAA